MQKKTKTPQQNMLVRRIIAVMLVILAGLFTAAYFGAHENLAALAKVQVYLLGKVALLLPVVLFIVGWKAFFGAKILVFSKKTCLFFLLMLCLLGTAHQFFVPVSEELYPHRLPEGGGLVGGSIILLAHRYLGVKTTLGILAFCWAVLVFALVPFKAIFGKLFSSKPQEEVTASVQNVEPKVKETTKQQHATKTLQMPERKVQEQVTKRNKLDDFYAREDLNEFTDGLKKKSPLHRVFNYGGNGTYEQDEVKQKIEQDPVQLPEWQEEKRNVVMRPIINYDGANKKNEEKAEPLQSVSVPLKFSFEKSRNREVDKPVIEEIPQQKITIIDSADKVAQSLAPKEVAQEELFSDDKAAYMLPPLKILDIPKITDPVSYEKDIISQCSILEQTLADFKVRAKVIAVTRGPSVTRFELEPAAGVKVSSVVNLADDIALKLAAPGVRIEAPIPGKAAIGIEVPNIKNDPVYFREVVDNDAVRSQDSKLCIGLGKDISGNIIPADLSKMPHLLVAGSTGSGKSVCINTIIAGILYKAHPDEVKLILVDPKVVELSNYNGIPHLLVPVVTDAKKAASALHWAVAEMERRYQTFADNHVREINSYNQQAQEKMPFIVIIIDELSDLMMVAKVDVEDAILRLAQKARAAGIHLILATQRPSVDVITGIVKANIPSRIAFAVSSQTDSRTILDMGGAEKLLGKGDMLFYPIGYNKPVRVQGAFVSDAELNRIVNFIIKQSIPVNYSDEVTEQVLECDAKEGNLAENGNGQMIEDELFADALRLVMDMGQASSSMLQRRFRIGYTRAARLVDTMEELGIVGQSVGSNPREVILSRQEIEERFLDNY